MFRPAATNAPPHGPPPSRALWQPRQCWPKSLPPLPPVADERWKVECVTLTLPRLYSPPPSAPPAGSAPLPPVPELPPLAATLSNVLLLMLTVPPPTHTPPPWANPPKPPLSSSF